MTRSTLLRLGFFLFVCLSALALGCWLRAVNDPEWLRPDTGQDPPVLRAWAIEADCYSQLARVQRILHGDGLIQNHFKVENWPKGLVPSTTAPFDYAILLLYFPLMLVTKYPLDWAGALISPALWAGLVVFWMLFRSREFTLVGRALLIFGSAAFPAIIWGTACGRPRHQSLIIALLAVALTLEYERWHLDLSSKKMVNIAAGIIWGLACWTSLFEPSFIFVLLVIYNLIVRRRESLAFLISFGFVMFFALLLEGFHIFIPTPADYNPLQRWLATIAEVRGIATFKQFMTSMTFITIFLPFIAWRLLAREGDRRTDWLLVLLTTALMIITLNQTRWFYYAALGEIFILARYCQIEPLRWSRLLTLAILFIGLEDADYTEYAGAQAMKIPNQPSIELAEIARSIDQPGGIMAPWWLSPGLLYFSGQPIVAGSSHCGISGIVASAKFFSSTSWPDAEKILRDRQVRWIVVYDDEDYGHPTLDFSYPVLNNSRQILGLDPYTDDQEVEANATVWRNLVNDQPEYIPRDLRLRAVAGQFKLYEYRPGQD
ncbi:MAG TPA: hypothetical protein VL981_08135 [Candidatus Methylacidiphilales bacterium]|nr:hypothetical protein [Candidatus Methylacidiphilales bacterium]